MPAPPTSKLLFLLALSPSCMAQIKCKVLHGCPVYRLRTSLSPYNPEPSTLQPLASHSHLPSSRSKGSFQVHCIHSHLHFYLHATLCPECPWHFPQNIQEWLSSLPNSIKKSLRTGLPCPIFPFSSLFLLPFLFSKPLTGKRLMSGFHGQPWALGHDWGTGHYPCLLSRPRVLSWGRCA